MRQRILQLYERGKGTREIAQFFGFCVAAVRRVRQQFSATRYAATTDALERASHAPDQGTQTAAATTAVRSTRRHAGRVGCSHGPALPNFHDRFMASAAGLEV